MFLYLFIFLLFVLIYLNSEKRPKNVKFLTFSMVGLAIFVGCSDMLGGYDRYIYGELFDRMADVTHEGGNPWRTSSFQMYAGEFGYGTLCALISFITKNRYIYIFIVTIIIYILLFISLRDYTSNYPFAVILFLALWFFFTFTYLRQVLSATTAWLAIRYISSRDLKRFLLIWFIAYSLHNSALIFLPMYFVPIKKYSEQTILYIMGAALLLGLTPIPSALFQAYGEIEVERANVENYSAEGSFRIAYLIEAAFFLYIILSQYKKIPQEPRTIVLTNMLFMFCAILLFFIRSENGGRLGWFYMIGCISIVTTVCNLKFNSQNKLLMLFVALLLYLRIVTEWGVLISPYKTFFTKGSRQGDYIHILYEYDASYDYDKFYR